MIFDGLRAKDLDEPSIPYQEFCQELKKGNVALVEFYAPNGDVANGGILCTQRGCSVCDSHDRGSR